MKINSPLAIFLEILQQVNQTASHYGTKLRNNEAATRAALIDPILNRLGWDPTKPEMIEYEKIYNDTRVDYALTDSSGKVCTIIEAKALGGNLNDPRITTKLMSYGFTYGIQEIVLTDGIIWQHFSQPTPGNVIPECIDLSKDNLIDCAEYFVRKLDACRFWFSTTTPVVEETPRSVEKVIEEIVVPKPLESFVPLSSVKNDLHGETPPKLLRLPNGKIVQIHYWREILTECLLFVLRENSSIPVPLPDKAGKKIHLISYEKPTKNVTFMPFEYNKKQVYLHLNYDSNNCVANAVYILSFLPENKGLLPAAVAFE